MDQSQLHRQLAEKRRFMLNEGFLNNRFLVLEELEGCEPHFVETILVMYIPSSCEYIQMLGEILENTPPNLAEVERLIMKLKGSSSSIGAAKLTVAIDEMLGIFKRYRTDTTRLGVALGRVRSEYSALKSHLQPYVEMLAQLRVNNRDEDAESVGSNNVNV